MADTVDEALYRELLPQWQALLTRGAGASHLLNTCAVAEWERRMAACQARCTGCGPTATGPGAAGPCSTR